MCASLRLSILPGVTLPRLYDAQVRDLNGDQQNDLLVGNSLTTNKVYINPGSGDFGSVVPFNVGSNTDDTRSIVIEAFDTQTAIIVGNAGQKNQLYFVPTVMTSFPSIQGEDIGTESDDTRSIAVGDVNSDTYTDIIATNAGMPPKMYLNPGGSNDFSEVTPVVAGGAGSGGVPGEESTYSLGLGDLDSNGFLDVIAGNQMYLNPGGTSAGDFTSVEAYSFTQLKDDVKSVAVWDLDGDGDQDVVFSTSNQVLIYLNPTGSMNRFFQGSSFFEGVNPTILTSGYESVIPRWVHLADLNGDGKVDLLVGMGVGAENHYYINPGSGDFQQAIRTDILGFNDNTRSIMAVDLNGDTVMDIVTANHGTTNKVYIGSLSGTTYSVANSAEITLGAETDKTYSIGIGDLNMDGVMDVVAGNRGESNKVRPKFS